MGLTNPNNSASSLTIGQLEAALTHRYPYQDALAWDRMGMCVGNPDACVQGVCVALDPTLEAIEYAKKMGSNVLVTHHPVFLESPDCIAPALDKTNIAGALIYEALSCDIALLNLHSALDAAPETHKLFADLLGCESEALLQSLEHDPHKGFGMVFSFKQGSAPSDLESFANVLSHIFECLPRIWPGNNSALNSFAFANGSASGLIKAAKLKGIDCLVCGEIHYHDALELSQSGISIIELGHDVSEYPLCTLLAQSVKETGVSPEAIHIIERPTHWFCPRQPSQT